MFQNLQVWWVAHAWRRHSQCMPVPGKYDHWHTTQHAGATAKVMITTTYSYVSEGNCGWVMGTHLADRPTQLKGIQKSTHAVTAPQTYVLYVATVGTHIGYMYICKQKYTTHTHIYCIHIRTYVCSVHTYTVYLYPLLTNQCEVQLYMAWIIYRSLHVYSIDHICMYVYKLTAAYMRTSLQNISSTPG